MDNAPAPVSVSARPDSFPSSDLDFVTPWADRPVVVDISDDVAPPASDWVGELARLEAMVTELKTEIANLRETTQG